MGPDEGVSPPLPSVSQQWGRGVSRAGRAFYPAAIKTPPPPTHTPTHTPSPVGQNNSAPAARPCLSLSIRTCPSLPPPPQADESVSARPRRRNVRAETGATQRKAVNSAAKCTARGAARSNCLSTYTAFPHCIFALPSSTFHCLTTSFHCLSGEARSNCAMAAVPGSGVPPALRRWLSGDDNCRCEPHRHSFIVSMRQCKTRLYHRCTSNLSPTLWLRGRIESSHACGVNLLPQDHTKTQIISSLSMPLGTTTEGRGGCSKLAGRPSHPQPDRHARPQQQGPRRRRRMRFRQGVGALIDRWHAD